MQISLALQLFSGAANSHNIRTLHWMEQVKRPKNMDSFDFDEMDENSSYEEEMDSSSIDSDSNVHEAKKTLFEPVTAIYIVDLMNQYIDDVKDVVGDMPSTTIRILLSSQQIKWDKQKLLEHLTGDDRDEFLSQANVCDPKDLVVRKPSQGLVTCSFCYCEYGEMNIIGLGCDHEYCSECWCRYLTTKIIEDGEVESIRCPTEGCEKIVDDITIMRMVTDEKDRNRYQRLMTNSFVQHNHLLRWCPDPDCKFAVRAKEMLDYRLNCSCKCGHSFCFECGAECHDPIPCALIPKWKTLKYLKENTKCCPNCNIRIENENCLKYMECLNCNHEFCWSCLNDYENDDHICAKVQTSKKAAEDQNRSEYYMELYVLHSESLEAEQKLMTDGVIQDLIDIMQQKGVSSDETKHLMEATNILHECRKQLMFSCIFAHWVEDHEQKNIFKHNQMGLQMATEALSRYLDQEITTDNVENIVPEVKNKAVKCKQLQNVLKKHIYEGTEQFWWTFNC